MENVFCKLKTENEKVLIAYRIAWQDKFFPSIWYRLNVEWWMLNRMNGWTNECECVNSEWVSECVNREINSLIARTGCAQSASSAKSMYTVSQACVCASTLHKHELQLRKSIANQFVIGPWRGAWSDEFKHFFVSLYNTAQHTIKVDYLWNVYN